MFRSARPRTPLRVVLYTKAGCCLCDEMKAELACADLADRYELTEVDIETDPALVERFGRSIPVLEIEGRVAFKGRLTSADFARKLDALVRGGGPSVADLIREARDDDRPEAR